MVAVASNGSFVSHFRHYFVDIIRIRSLGNNNNNHVIRTIKNPLNFQIKAEARYDDESQELSNMEAGYGLFAGRSQLTYLAKLYRYDLKSIITQTVRLSFCLINHHLAVTCNFGRNKCFYSCQQTTTSREDEFERIMNDENLPSCPESTARTRRFNEQVNNNETATTSSRAHMNQSRASAKHENEFLSAGLWLTTVIFLALTIAFASLSGLFSLINIWCNPVRSLLGVAGLYVWNLFAAALCCLTMIFWASLHLIFIVNNIGITDTLRSVAHYSSDGLASLGYSFWILLATLACHLINCGLIYYRNYLLQQEPKAPVITVNKNDSTILVY